MNIYFVPLKVIPTRYYTLVPTFFPILEALQKIIFVILFSCSFDTVFISSIIVQRRPLKGLFRSGTRRSHSRSDLENTVAATLQILVKVGQFWYEFRGDPCHAQIIGKNRMALANRYVQVLSNFSSGDSTIDQYPPDIIHLCQGFFFQFSKNDFCVLVQLLLRCRLYLLNRRVASSFYGPVQFRQQEKVTRCQIWGIQWLRHYQSVVFGHVLGRPPRSSSFTSYWPSENIASAQGSFTIYHIQHSECICAFNFVFHTKFDTDYLINFLDQAKIEDEPKHVQANQLSKIN